MMTDYICNKGDYDTKMISSVDTHDMYIQTYCIYETMVVEQQPGPKGPTPTTKALV
jgi:hypothetical protein